MSSHGTPEIPSPADEELFGYGEYSDFADIPADDPPAEDAPVVDAPVEEAPVVDAPVVDLAAVDLNIDYNLFEAIVEEGMFNNPLNPSPSMAFADMEPPKADSPNTVSPRTLRRPSQRTSSADSPKNVSPRTLRRPSQRMSSAVPPTTISPVRTLRRTSQRAPVADMGPTLPPVAPPGLHLPTLPSTKPQRPAPGLHLPTLPSTEPQAPAQAPRTPKQTRFETPSTGQQSHAPPPAQGDVGSSYANPANQYDANSEYNTSSTAQQSYVSPQAQGDGGSSYAAPVNQYGQSRMHNHPSTAQQSYAPHPVQRHVGSSYATPVNQYGQSRMHNHPSTAQQSYVSPQAQGDMGSSYATPVNQYGQNRVHNHPSMHGPNNPHPTGNQFPPGSFPVPNINRNDPYMNGNDHYIDENVPNNNGNGTYVNGNGPNNNGNGTYINGNGHNNNGNGTYINGNGPNNNMYNPNMPLLDMTAQGMAPDHYPPQGAPSAMPSVSPRHRSPSLKKTIMHARKSKNRPDNDPSNVYPRLPAQPKWGPPRGRAKSPIFDYYRGGPELYPNLRYSKEELWAFFTGAGRPSPRRMTVWIQSTPSQVNNRYQASSASSKCRYKNCPVPTGTILKGFFRVALDEFPDLTTEGRADPFHNAGYLHLYCFEEIFDVGLLLHTANLYGFKVTADTRNHLREQRNPMAITHHHEDLGAVFGDWMQTHNPRANAVWNMAMSDPDVGGRRPQTAVPRKSTLWYALTHAMLRLEVRNRQSLRARRAGANLERHRGDLRIFLAIKDQMKAEARAGGGGGDDDDDDDENHAPAPSSAIRLSWSTSEHSASPSPSPPPAAAPKRKRKAPAPPQPNPIDTDLTSDFVPDGSWLDAPLDAPQHVSPQDHVRRLYAHPSAARTTRKQSREAAQAIVDAVATTPGMMTRSQQGEIDGLLARQPDHVQERVREALTPVLPQWDDKLEERVGRLSKRQRREVDGFVSRRERDKRLLSYQ